MAHELNWSVWMMSRLGLPSPGFAVAGVPAERAARPAVVAAVVMADKLDLLDMDWIYDWWPVPVFLLGVYFIVAAILDKKKARNKARAFGDGEDF